MTTELSNMVNKLENFIIDKNVEAGGSINSVINS